MNFEIDFTKFQELTSSDCAYCGVKPSQKYTPASRNEEATAHGVYIYNGIDRVDSRFGYLNGNVIPCCKRCNIAKSNMPQDEFIKLIKDIYENYVMKSLGINQNHVL